MKFLFLLLLFFQINSTNFEMNILFLNSIQTLPLYRTINTYFYFYLDQYCSSDCIYLYLEDDSYFVNYVAICYTDDNPFSSSTINNCTFSSINHYRDNRNKEIYQYFYKIPCINENSYENNFIIVQYSAKNPGILKAEISEKDLFDKATKKNDTPVSAGPIVGIVLLAIIDIGIYFYIVCLCCTIMKRKIRDNSKNLPNQPSSEPNISNEPLAQPDEINQNIQNREHIDTPIINNEC